VGVWAYGQFSSGAAAKASEAYAKGLASLQKGDLNASLTQFGEAAKGPAGYRSLALMQQAVIRLDQNNQTQAIALLDQAASAAPDQTIGDVARLKAAYLLLDTASLADITKRLTPLMAPDRPYHAQAREALALAKIGAGQLKDARSDLAVLQLMTDTPDSLRQRAGAVIAIIDFGTAGSLKNLVKAAATAPPVPPPGLPGAAAPDAQTGN
jgi:hypothetical protein